MDHGKLTDNGAVDFRNVVIIMTTNAGAAELAKAAIGFKAEQEGDDGEAVNELLPEFETGWFDYPICQLASKSDEQGRR